MDNNIINEVIIDLTNTHVMDETPQVSKVALADEVIQQEKEHASKQSTTSNRATPREKEVLDIVIVYSFSSGPTPFNHASPTAMTRGQVQEMIGQTMDTFVEL